MISRPLSLPALAVIVTSVFSAPVFAQPARKVDRGLLDALTHGDATQNVIISLAPGCRDFVRQSLVNHGDRIKSEHPIIDALSVTLHSDDVGELSTHDCVKSLALDALVSAKAAPDNKKTSTIDQSSSSSSVSNPLRETLGLPAIPTPSTPTGEAGVGVAIIDSGIAPLDDFAGRITGFYDFTQGGIPVAPFDDYGHGTHVAGLIGSSGKQSNYQYMGIAPNVRMVGLKVLDATGVGTTSDVIKAIEYVIANKSFLNVQIINLSLGHPIYAPAKDDPLVQAVEQASAAGLVVVTAAGNYGQNQKGSGSGYTGITSPGNAPSAITVGAVMTQNTVTRADDVVAPYSSRGPTWFDAFAKPNVVAPGHGLFSDATTTSYLFKSLPSSQGKKNGSPFLSLSGTSMAAAVNTGVVALILQVHNQNGLHGKHPLTPNAIKAILEFTAIPVAGADYLTQGAGEINAAGAIALTKSIDTDAPAGEWWLRTGVTPSTVIGNITYGWNQKVIWGSNVMGGHVVYTNNIVWAPTLSGAPTSSGRIAFSARTMTATSSGERTSSGARSMPRTWCGAPCNRITRFCLRRRTATATSSGVRPMMRTSSGARRPTTRT